MRFSREKGWSFPRLDAHASSSSSSFLSAANEGKHAAEGGQGLAGVQSVVFDANVGGTCAGLMDPEIVTCCQVAAARLATALGVELGVGGDSGDGGWGNG